MNPTLNNGSAKIYQFPAGRRAGSGSRPGGETGSSPEQGSSSVDTVACSGSWYHEAAIQEAKPARER